MRALLLSLMLASACGAPPSGDDVDGATGKDAGADGSDGLPPMADALDAADGAGPACTTSGDGSLFAQCCVWNAAACDVGLYCYWDAVPTHGAGDGACFPPGAVALGGVCDLSTNDCVPGASCLWDDATPKTGTGTCRALCNPAAPSCPATEQCEVPIGDGSLGFCSPGGV